MKQYTIVGQTDGQVRVNWEEGESVKDVVLRLLSSEEHEKWENDERDTPPFDEIISVFEGHQRDIIGEFHEGTYPLSREDAQMLIAQEREP